MAHQDKRGSNDQKTGRRSINLIEVFLSRGPFSACKGADHPSSDTLKVGSSKPAALPASQCKSRSFHVGLFGAFPDRQGPWVPKAWASICNALQKQRTVDAATESSLDVMCSHQNKQDGLPSLGKQILLYISEKSAAKGRVLLSSRSCCECNLAKRANSLQTIGEGFASIFVGVFSQAYAKEVSHLVQRLVDSEWTQRNLHHAAFARLRGVPGLMLLRSSHPEMDKDEWHNYEESMPPFLSQSQNLLWKFFGKQILDPDAILQQQNCPNKEMLVSVQDFFVYTEFEGKKLFDELDRDADGKLTLDDLKVAMRNMKLPASYAKDLIQRKHWLWSAKDYGWSEFSSLLQEKEPVIVQLFNSLGVSKSGTVKSSHVKDSLVKVGLPASEDNVAAMMRFLAEDAGDGLKYGQFRRFMLLLPTEQLTQDPWGVWLTAATSVSNGREHLREDLKFPFMDYISLAYKNMQNEDVTEGQVRRSL